jgi:hypothetical protein
MPNWCSNSIEIVGPRDKIRALWLDAKQSEGLLNALRPQPAGLDITAGREGPDGSPEQVALEAREAENLEKHGARNWYDWNVNNWGTKWDVGLDGLEYEEDADGNFDNGTGIPHARITGWFDSAWAPPTNAVAYFCEANPDVRVTLDYYEPGMCFVGRMIADNGEVEEDDCVDYTDATSETVRDIVGSEMCDFWNLEEELASYEEDEEDEEENA